MCIIIHSQAAYTSQTAGYIWRSNEGTHSSAGGDTVAAKVDPQPVRVGTHGSAGGNIMAAVDHQPVSVGTYGGKTVAAMSLQMESFLSKKSADILAA